MRRLIFDVPRWHVFLHREARGLPNVDANDSPHLKLADELFDRLYAGGIDSISSDHASDWKDWAEKLHSTCENSPAFSRLARECIGDADAAALAVEKLWETLQPQMQQSPEDVQAPSLRRSLSSACESASTLVDSYRDAADGLAGVGVGDASASGRGFRPLSLRLKNDSRLRRIALLAGRMKRIVAAKQKAKVRRGADEFADVELGSSLARLLPSELLRLTHPRLRLHLLASLLEHRAMQYRLEGNEALGRGPLVVCLDKSGSMEGDRDVWATALAVALLELAQLQRRSFALLSFDANVRREVRVAVGEQLPMDALCGSCDGGTSIAHVVERGLDVISDESAGSLRRADIVLITDGASDADSAEGLRLRASSLGVTVLGLGIGVESSALSPWCDEVHAVSRLDTVEDAVSVSAFNI